MTTTGFRSTSVLASLLVAAGSITACDSGDDRITATRSDAGTEVAPIADDGGVDASSHQAPPTEAVESDAEMAWYQPPPTISWHWQLAGPLNTSHDVALYDVDLIDTSRHQIAELQSRGRRVICYFSAGSYESWRPDADMILPADVGDTMDGFADERWLNIRSDHLRGVMALRLDLAREKGCDGVEPDNVDGFANNTGFDLEWADQLAFNTWLATEAHARNLAAGLKNDLDQVEALEPHFDFAVNEQCFEFVECHRLDVFTRAGKPVLNAEYERHLVADAEAREQLCASARAMMISSLVLPPELDDRFRYACPDQTAAAGTY